MSLPRDLPPHPERSLLIVDDDLIIREIVSLLAADAGYFVTVSASGEEVLTVVTTLNPHVILCDLQMPGIRGNPLATALRNLCAPETRVIAMSGTTVPDPLAIGGYDAFLLKPFNMADLSHALETITPAENILNAATYSGLAQSMTREQLTQLYTICLDDADQRIELLRKASDNRDADAYQRGAHSLKGGCGMVGASELATLACEMEENGLPPVNSSELFDKFIAASLRFRRILNAQPFL